MPSPAMPSGTERDWRNPRCGAEWRRAVSTGISGSTGIEEERRQARGSSVGQKWTDRGTVRDFYQLARRTAQSSKAVVSSVIPTQNVPFTVGPLSITLSLPPEKQLIWLNSVLKCGRKCLTARARKTPGNCGAGERE